MPFRRLDPAPLPSDVLSHAEMCVMEGLSLQHGMNFRTPRKPWSTVLMSVRPGAPYRDRVEEEGRVLIYEGHDAPRSHGGPDPKRLNQPEMLPSGKPTPNGKFHQAAQQHKLDGSTPEVVRAFEKIRDGLWVYNGEFHLTDSWRQKQGGRQVFKFRLEVALGARPRTQRAIDQTRVIPSEVKRSVWDRDKGKCVECGAHENLHFDHVIPFSKGGSSLTADNIQLLCVRHNLEKKDRIA
jgi:hypothetical protein